MSKETKRTPVAKRIAAAVSAGVLAASMMGAPLALAEDPGVGSQTAKESGTATDTQLNVIALGGASDQNQYSDNLAFTVPSALSFVAKADGTLITPAAHAAYIENESVFTAHVTSIDVDASNGWSIVEDAVNTGAENQATLTIAPTTGAAAAVEADAENGIEAAEENPGTQGTAINAAKVLEKTAIGSPDAGVAHEWNMAVAKAGAATDDRVQLTTAGEIGNVSKDLSATQQFGVIHWYLTAGNAAATADVSGD